MANRGTPELARVAGMIGEPARAAMLGALLGGRALAAGVAWLATLGIDAAELGRRRRALVRPCLDWTERRDHVAGAVGAALAETMLERRWLARLDGTRAVRLTLRGRDGLYRVLGLEVEPPAPAVSRA